MPRSLVPRRAFHLLTAHHFLALSSRRMAEIAHRSQVANNRRRHISASAEDAGQKRRCVMRGRIYVLRYARDADC